eukprot:CAMPEP_0113879250 /NCGR_PEP_ID=MMETSP0780_2-20120614/7137_1 /TAXON_ID=652834 /ORGANISM="Palpitomonas bilix" /LENGTH=290 /DNA_ID=CAMNT_0000865817 /DNA_START=209 /DNA_END=1081 /DNA_ORIENTATION=+ /assembly_acc=CAM_ASM_000599
MANRLAASLFRPKHFPSTLACAARLYPVASFHTTSPAHLSAKDVHIAATADSVRKAVEELKEGGSFKVSVDEYFKALEKHGVTKKDDKFDSLYHLHRSGAILHFHNAKDGMKDTVFLRPDEVMKSFMEAVDVSGEKMQAALDKVKGDLEAVKKELDQLFSVKNKLDRSAKLQANVVLSGGFLFVVAQWLLMARLTWWEFSWDIMEPITFFVTSATGIVGYTFFLATKQDFEYGNIFEVVARRKMRKLYAKHNFDYDHFKHLLEDKKEMEREVRRLQKRIAENTFGQAKHE